MYRIHLALLLLAALVVPHLAAAGGYSRVYLVPAVKACPTASTCPREFASSFIFDAIVLHSPATKFMPVGKPSLILEVHGVRDASHALVTGTLTLRVLSGRVSLPGLGTFPDDSPLTQQAPIPVALKNGDARFSYKPSTGVPNGTIVNGGGVEVYDPDGNLLAVTGSQSRP
jgi:hypothetical protein